MDAEKLLNRVEAEFGGYVPDGSELGMAGGMSARDRAAVLLIAAAHQDERFTDDDRDSLEHLAEGSALWSRQASVLQACDDGMD